MPEDILLAWWKATGNDLRDDQIKYEICNTDLFLVSFAHILRFCKAEACTAFTTRVFRGRSPACGLPEALAEALRSRPQCCPRASANGPHQPSSLSGTGASFSTTLDPERGYLELDLSITTVFVVMTEHKLRFPDLQPAPGLWSNATGAVPTHTAPNSFLGQATILSQMAQATHLQQPCPSLQGHSLEVYMNHSVLCFMIFTGLKQTMVR